MISVTFDQYQKDVRIMERCCRSVRYMLRSASQEVSLFLLLVRVILYILICLACRNFKQFSGANC